MGREVEVVFAFGGDGTMREAAAGLLGSPAALGLIPGGTANVLGLALGLPRDPVARGRRPHVAPRAAVRRRPRGGEPLPDDGLGRARCHGAGSLDVRLNVAVRRAAFAAQGMREWWRYPYPALGLTADGERLEATFAAVLEHSFLWRRPPSGAGGAVDDGWLDLVLFRGRWAGRRAILRLGPDPRHSRPGGATSP